MDPFNGSQARTGTISVADQTFTITQAVNQPPDGVIDEPIFDTTIRVGESVFFASTGTDPDNDLPLTYSWSFGGGASGSNLEDPGEVTFPNEDVYLVTLTVTDSEGLSDPTPATRTVTVVQGQPPNGIIDLPAEDVAILPGESVVFAIRKTTRPSLSYGTLTVSRRTPILRIPDRSPSIRSVSIPCPSP